MTTGHPLSELKDLLEAMKGKPTFLGQLAIVAPETSGYEAIAKIGIISLLAE